MTNGHQPQDSGPSVRVIDRAGQPAANRSGSEPRSGDVTGGATFTNAELSNLHAAYRSGARGTELIALRDGERILTLAIPPLRSEELLYRHMRDAAKRLRAGRSNGWLLARRAVGRVDGSTNPVAADWWPAADTRSSVNLLLIHTVNRQADGSLQTTCSLSPLGGEGPPTFYACPGMDRSNDRILRLLVDAIRLGGA